MTKNKNKRRRFASYEEFFVYYLQQHGNPKTKIYHCFGLAAASLVVMVAVYSGRYPLLIAAPVVGYGFAWFAHWRFERNLPATFGYPLWSFISDFRMAYGVLVGKSK